MYLDFDSMINPALSYSSNHWFNASSSSLVVIVYAFVFNSFGASLVKFILWSYSHHSSNFSNYFLLNKCIKGQIYSGRFSGFVLSSSFPISLLSCSIIFIICVLLVLNLISWCFILQLPGHLINFIVLFFQLTSGLCLISQLCPKNMSVLFRSVTATSSYFLCLLISISRGTTLVTSPFFVPSALKTLNEKLISVVCIFFFLTSCSLIPV